MASGGYIKAVLTGINTHSEHCMPHISYNYLIILKSSSHKQMTYKMTLFKTIEDSMY